jgi:hypothetical protein
MNDAALLAAGLLLGWITAPLLRARARGAEHKEEEGEEEEEAGAAAGPAPAPPAPSAAAGRGPSLPHALAGAGAAEPPACPLFATDGSGPAAPAPPAAAAADPGTLDLSTPEAIAAFFSSSANDGGGSGSGSGNDGSGDGGGGGLAPLQPARDGRPIVAFDLEATGLSVARDRVVEIAAVKVWPDGRVQVKGPQRLNPGREAAARMPRHVVAIHGLDARALEREPRWEDVAGGWREFMRGCDLAGYNALRYDVPLLRWVG